VGGLGFPPFLTQRGFTIGKVTARNIETIGRNIEKTERRMVG
jgi:hypothetical protein